ncbi:MAG: hypothetical protein K2H18_06905, partial [Muribaculaceae bacterium]|nr:hypothetical protein [Muribaculaceae bacterium]
MNNQQTTTSASRNAATSAGTQKKHTHNGKLIGNVSMFVAKTFSGLNENALKYLLPTWMNAFTGV